MKDRVITVCDACLTASCWHGEFMCEESRYAGTIEKTVEELNFLNLEHPSNYTKEKIEGTILRTTRRNLIRPAKGTGY